MTQASSRQPMSLIQRASLVLASLLLMMVHAAAACAALSVDNDARALLSGTAFLLNALVLSILIEEHVVFRLLSAWKTLGGSAKLLPA